MALDADENHHKFYFVDKAGFNMAKRRRIEWNFIGQWATIKVPGQQEAKCGCIRRWFAGTVIVWDNVRFYHAQLLQAWFQAQPQLMYFPPYTILSSTLLRKFFQLGRGKCLIGRHINN